MHNLHQHQYSSQFSKPALSNLKLLFALLIVSLHLFSTPIPASIAKTVLISTPKNPTTSKQTQDLQPIDLNTPLDSKSGTLKAETPEAELEPEASAKSTANNNQQNGSSGLVIQATKLYMPIEEIGGSVSVITKEQIQQMQAQSVTEILQEVPGVTVVQNGGLGGTTSVFIRGTDSDHTLILLDGVRINDPVSPARTFNYLDQLSVDSIEQVEVLKGPQSTLYGSDAIGGVINIVTPSGEGRPTLTGRVTAGSFGILQQDVSAGGQLGSVKGFFHMTRQDVNNFSAAGARYGNRERDGYHNTNLIGKLQYQPFPNLDLDVLTQYSRAKFDLDRAGGFNTDDPNFDSSNRFFLLNGGGKLRLLDNRFEQVLRVSVTDHKRKTWNDPDTASNSFERSEFNGQVFNLDAHNNTHLLRNSVISDTLTLGLNLQHEKADSDARFDGTFGPFRSTFRNRSATNLAFYAQDVIRLFERLYTTVGVRTDDHNRFGRHTTYKAGSSYLIEKTGTTLKASYGTGFKAPALFELYSSFGGNPNLNPETTAGWDAGIEQSIWHNRVQLSSTYFQNRIKNLIVFNNNLNQNISKARTQGIETAITVHPCQKMTLQGNYTYTDTKDLSSNTSTSGDPLLRRPRHQYSIKLNYTPIKKLNLNVLVSHVGLRNDLNFVTFPADPVKLKAYTLVNLAAQYHLSKHLTLFGRLANLFDTPYEMVKGYGTARISAYGGLQFKL